MHIQPIFLIVLLVLKMAQLKHYKNVAPNDLFVGILIVYLLIQSLTSNTKEFHTPGATDNLIDPQAWTNLHTLLRDLYSSGTLTIPGNVHINGDLLVGTYKNENGVLKSFEDSIEHTCVWKPTINGNATTGMGWMNDSTKNATWKANCKPATGGGVFSFRAGHMDLHPVFISRKQPRQDNTGTTAKANTVNVGDYRLWNPTLRDNIHFVAGHEYVLNNGVVPDNRKHGCLDVGPIGASGDINTSKQMHCNDLYVHNIVDRGTGWVTFYSNVNVGYEGDGGIKHLKVQGGLCLPQVRNNPNKNNAPDHLKYGWLYRTGNNDDIRIWDNAP
jgi:hypothetical protein